MAKKAIELQFSAPNKVGVLACLTACLKEAKVNIQHVWACGDGKTACMGMVVDKVAAAKKVLKEHGIKAKESEVLVLNLQNKMGSLAKISGKLANNKINITCLSATTNGPRASVLISTNQNKKAVRLV